MLIELAARDADNFDSRKQLAIIFRDEEKYAEAIRYGREALYVDVLDVEVHRVLGESYRAQGNLERAIREYEVAATLQPEDDELAVALARALVAAGRKADARALLQTVLERNADNPPARKLMQSLKRVD